MALTRCEGAFRFSLICLPLTSLFLVLYPTLEPQQFEVMECSYDQFYSTFIYVPEVSQFTQSTGMEEDLKGST